MALTLEEVVEFYLKHTKKKKKTKAKEGTLRRKVCSNEEEHDESIPSGNRKTKIKLLQNESSNYLGKETHLPVNNQVNGNDGPQPNFQPARPWIIKNYHHRTGQVSSSHHLRRYEKGGCDLQIPHSWKNCQTEMPSSHVERNGNIHFGNESSSSNARSRPSLLSSRFDESESIVAGENFLTINHQTQQKELNSSPEKRKHSSNGSSYPLSNFYRKDSLSVGQNMKVKQVGQNGNIVEFGTSELRSSLNEEIWKKSNESSSSSDSDSSGPPFNSKHLKKLPSSNRGHDVTLKCAARILSTSGQVRVLPSASSDDSSSDENQSSSAPCKPLKTPKTQTLVGRSLGTKTATKTVEKGLFHPHEDEEILAHFFSSLNGQEETEYIMSITGCDLQVLALRLKRPIRALRRHWNVMIRPTLLNYYNKTLLVSIRKRLCEYFISNKVECIKTFNWDDLLKMFPCETIRSLGSEIYSVVRSFEDAFPGFEHLPLHEKISRAKSWWKEYELNGRIQSNRKRIIQTYLSIRKRDLTQARY